MMIDMIHYRILDEWGNLLHSSMNTKHFDGWIHEESAMDVAKTVAQSNQYFSYKIQLKHKNSPNWVDSYNFVMDI